MQLHGILAELSGGTIGLIIAGVVLLLFIFWVAGAYNGLVAMRNRVKNGWAQIDVQLKRRHDLIPNLVETVKGFMTHEKELLENITKARSGAMAVSGQGAGAQSAAEGLLSSSLGQLRIVMENYPDIKSNTNVTELMEELTSTENKIAFARQHYNDEVMQYNTNREMFPRNLVANNFGFKEESFFEIQEADREVPKVSFS